MKKLAFIIAAVVAVAAFTGCTKEYNTYIDGAQVLSYEYDITPAMWKRVRGANLPGGYNYLYASFENSDITRDVVDFGTVTAEIWNIYDQANNLGSWNPMPYVYPLELNLLDDNGNHIIVAENIRFEWEQGMVTFVIQDLDGLEPEDMSSTITIKVNVIRNIRY